MRKLSSALPVLLAGTAFAQTVTFDSLPEGVVGEDVVVEGVRLFAPRGITALRAFYIDDATAEIDRRPFVEVMSGVNVMGTSGWLVGPELMINDSISWSAELGRPIASASVDVFWRDDSFRVGQAAVLEAIVDGAVVDVSPLVYEGTDELRHTRLHLDPPRAFDEVRFSANFAGAGMVAVFDNITLDAACRADLTGDGVLDLFDFLAFQNLFAAGDPLADFDGDGALTFFDFLAFQNEFAAGCP